MGIFCDCAKEAPTIVAPSSHQNACHKKNSAQLRDAKRKRSHTRKPGKTTSPDIPLWILRPVSAIKKSLSLFFFCQRGLFCVACLLDPVVLSIVIRIMWCPCILQRCVLQWGGGWGSKSKHFDPEVLQRGFRLSYSFGSGELLENRLHVSHRTFPANFSREFGPCSFRVSAPPAPKNSPSKFMPTVVGGSLQMFVTPIFCVRWTSTNCLIFLKENCR